MIDKEKPFLLYCCFVQVSKEDEAALKASTGETVSQVEQRIKEAVEAAHPVPSAQALVFQPQNPDTQRHIEYEAECVDAMQEKGIGGLLDLLKKALEERERVTRLQSALKNITYPYRGF